MTPKEMKYNRHYGDVRETGDVLRRTKSKLNIKKDWTLNINILAFENAFIHCKIVEFSV